MRWWTAGAGRFWAKGAPSLVVLFLAGAFCHDAIVPPRIYWSDYLIAVPVILCGVISIRAGQEVDFGTRFSYGIVQGIVLIAIYSNYWSVLANPYETLLDWAARIAIYAVIFAGITQALSTHAPEPRRDPMRCRTCGYSLRGLTVPRCPECNTPFDARLLDKDAPQ